MIQIQLEILLWLEIAVIAVGLACWLYVIDRHFIRPKIRSWLNRRRHAKWVAEWEAKNGVRFT